MNNQGNLTYLQSFSNHAYRLDSLKLGAEIKKKFVRVLFFSASAHQLLLCVKTSGFHHCHSVWLLGCQLAWSWPDYIGGAARFPQCEEQHSYFSKLLRVNSLSLFGIGVISQLSSKRALLYRYFSLIHSQSHITKLWSKCTRKNPLTFSTTSGFFFLPTGPANISSNHTPGLISWSSFISSHISHNKSLTLDYKSSA